jgi:hypothetical protein
MLPEANHHCASFVRYFYLPNPERGRAGAHDDDSTVCFEFATHRVGRAPWRITPADGDRSTDCCMLTLEVRAHRLRLDCCVVCMVN